MPRVGSLAGKPSSTEWTAARLMLPFSFTMGGFIRSRAHYLLAARPQTPSDSSNHSTSPTVGGGLMPSATSLGRDNRIGRRYGGLLDPLGRHVSKTDPHYQRLDFSRNGAGTGPG